MKIGQGIPLYCTGLGKALLAYLPEWEVRSIIGQEKFHRYTANTLLNVELLLKDLSQIRQRGYSIDDEEHLPGILCVGAPVFNAKNEPIAAISVATLMMTPLKPEQIRELGQSVCQTAESFTESLGGRSPRH